MARATSMERIEKLRLQLEEAERKEQSRQMKQAEAQAERDRKKRESLEQRLGRLFEQHKRIGDLIAETQAALDELPAEAFEVVSDDVSPGDDA